MTDYKFEIDGLRAIAIIAVITNHFNEQFLPSGYLGVDIFFVISGYVITLSLLNKKHENFIQLIGTFYKKRIRRILPALVVFVFLISLAVGIFCRHPRFSLYTGASSLFGLSCYPSEIVFGA